MKRRNGVDGVDEFARMGESKTLTNSKGKRGCSSSDERVDVRAAIS